MYSSDYYIGKLSEYGIDERMMRRLIYIGWENLITTLPKTGEVAAKRLAAAYHTMNHGIYCRHYTLAIGILGVELHIDNICQNQYEGIHIIDCLQIPLRDPDSVTKDAARLWNYLNRLERSALEEYLEAYVCGKGKCRLKPKVAVRDTAMTALKKMRTSVDLDRFWNHICDRPYQEMSALCRTPD